MDDPLSQSTSVSCHHSLGGGDGGGGRGGGGGLGGGGEGGGGVGGGGPEIGHDLTDSSI